MEPDFSGYATKAGLVCSDGVTIMPFAFRDQNDAIVPLVWQHGRTSPKNVLGHAKLESRDDGTYAYCFFNETDEARHAKVLVSHGDIKSLSIWANQLIKKGKQVIDGAIREVSLVLSGANPGAVIDNISIQHDDGIEDLDGEAIIYTGLDFDNVVHMDDVETLLHADGMTIKEIYDSMTEEQQNVCHYLIGLAVEDAAQVTQSNADTGTDTDDAMSADQKGTDEMAHHNVFDPTKKDEIDTQSAYELTHEDVKGIVADAMKTGSLKEAVQGFALEHGITDIEILFPEAVAMDNVPEFLKRRTEWVGGFLSGTRKSPFNRIRTMTADITVEEARAKGYVKGNMKREEFFGLMQRVTTPTTVYKKQKLDRDDITDITDFDMVAWLRAEMRLMLDEEIARAALIGDGRDVAHEDKINEQCIRPIAKDSELYVTPVYVNLDDASSSMQEVIDALILSRQYYKGTGLPTMYTTETYIARFLLQKDTLGRAIWDSVASLATYLRVNTIVPVEVLEDEDEIVAVLVNPIDYVMGATAGGQVSFFDDFDIDFNQYKYLVETRLCGALVRIKSALVVKKVAAAATPVVPTMPTFDQTTGELDIPTVAGVVYKNASGTVLTTGGSPYTVAENTSYVVYASPATSSYYFAPGTTDNWNFINIPTEAE